MRKWLISTALIVATLFIITSQHGGQSPQQSDPMISDKQESYGKKSVLEQDVETTRALYARQCITALEKTLGHIQQADDEHKKIQELKEVLKQYPEWESLTWVKPDGKTVRALPENTSVSNMDKQILKAKKALEHSPRYQSEVFHNGSHAYQIIGVNRNGHRLVALVPHHISAQLETQQKKNLHVIIYPDEKYRSRMQTIQPDTLNPISVRSPEQNEGNSHVYEGEVVVKFKQQPDPDRLKRIQDAIDCVHVRQLNGSYIFTSQSKTTHELMRYFLDEDIEYVEPHYMYFPNDEAWKPNDELFDPYQWNLPLVAALEGWNISRGSEQVIIAVLDTGIDLEHTDLQANLVQGANMINEGEPPRDEIGHGTHVAGVIAATVNNGEGIAGMSWFNRIMPVKVLDETGTGSSYAVARGIIWATDNGAKVINMSLGNYANAEFLHDAIRYAYERDVVLIAATGNDNTDQPGYPAAYPEVLAVAANDAKQNRAVFSNFGDYVDVSAPGVNIASTYPGNRYAAMSGTSMASPHVAALAGLIRSVRPDLSNQEVMDIIRQTATDLGPSGKDHYFGYGQIDVYRALSRVTNQQMEWVDPAPTELPSPIHWLQQKWDRLRSLF